MTAQHRDLAAGRWRSFSLAQQLGNVGGEVSRALRWRRRDRDLSDKAVFRALELLDLSIQDPRWKRRLKELTRARESLCDAWLGGKTYGTRLEDLDRYFFAFALLARKL